MRPKVVDQWITDIPTANLGETARLVYKALVETNHHNYSHQDRIYFLESLRESAQYAAKTMQKYFVGINFPLPAKGQKVATATRQIYVEMATGYMISIEDMVKGSALFTDNKQLATLIHRAINYLGQVLLTSYQIYTPFPNKTWSELHKLYAYAEARKFLHITVNDVQYHHNKKSNIAEAYSRILLLSLTSPNRLRHGEVNKVYDTLERWATHCNIQKISENKTVKGLFAINLDKDEPPRSSSLVTENCNTASCRILDTEQLANEIRNELKNNKDIGSTTLTGIDMQRPDLSHDLLRRLLVTWGVTSKRVFPRTNKSEKVQVTLGLSATHANIANIAKRRRNDTSSDRLRGTRAQDAFTNTAQFETADIHNMNDKQPDVWDMIYPDGSAIQHPLAMKEHPEEETNAEQEEIVAIDDYQSESWVILNESANGYCLKNLSRSEHKVQVGELMGIQRSGDGHTWKWGIGVIRWLKLTDNRTMQLGIEMLTPDAAAIGIKPALDTGKKEAYQRTLMLPELKAINQPTTLITGPVPYRKGSNVVLKILGKTLAVKLTNSLQNTGLFAQFEFEITESDSSKTEKQNSLSGEFDFDNLWSSI